MRIAQVAPLYESVPPRRYGSAERVVAKLTEELCRAGHDYVMLNRSACAGPSLELAAGGGHNRIHAA